MGGVKVRQPSGGQECSGRAECSTCAMQSRVAQSTGTPLAEPYGGVSAYGFSVPGGLGEPGAQLSLIR